MRIGGMYRSTVSVLRCIHPAIQRSLLKSKSTLTRAYNGLQASDSYCSRAIQTSAIMAGNKLKIADRLTGSTGSVWVEFTKLVVEQKALNLGQGFPDFFPPLYIREELAKIALEDDVFMSQYTRSYGHPRLVKALARLFSPILQHEIDPMEDILISGGAYGALFCSVQGLVNPGDEVIIIEPFFDCYEPMVRVAGGTPVFVPLRPFRMGTVMSSAEWKLDPEELASKFNSKTKMIFINNPNNPLGKIFTLEELELIADLCKKHDVICVSDDVYEWITYDNNKLIKMATLPGMWDRTLTIGSAGKTFSLTGWKIGWAIGPSYLMKGLQAVHQNCVYNYATPTQEALGRAFEKEIARLDSPECYFNSLPLELTPKRDRLARVLQEVGMMPIIPEGGYFMLADYSKLNFEPNKTSDESKDFQFVKWLTIEKKLASIPPSAFYCKEHKHLAANLIRLCFIKEDSTLDKAEQIFKDWKATQ